MKKLDMMKELCAQLTYHGGTVNYVNTHGSKNELRQHDAIVAIGALIWTAKCMGWKVEYRTTEIFDKLYYVGFAVSDGKNVVDMWCTSCHEGVDDNTYRIFKAWRGENDV